MAGGDEADIAEAIVAAPRFGLSRVDALVVLQQVLTATGEWRAVGKALGMNAAELRKFEDAFEHEQRELAQKWLAGQ
jgi:serine/threonine-protein kinase HipA